MMWRLIVWLQLTAIVWVGDVNGPTRLVRAKPQTPLGLYSNDEDVIVLTQENFKERVYGKSMPLVTETKIMKILTDVRNLCITQCAGWRRVVSIGAVDCASDENVYVCRDYEIRAYPSVKLFPPGFSAETEKDKLTVVTSQDLAGLKNTVLDFITHPEFHRPSSWPRLAPLTSLGDIWDEATDEHKFVVVVFEEENSVVGREVILDLVDFPSLLVRCMLKKDVEKFGTFKYPSLYLINKDSSFQHLASSWTVTETKIMKILTDVPNLRITQRAGEGLNDPIMLANVLLVVRELSIPTRYPETKSGSGLVDTDRHTFVGRLLSLLHLKDSQGRPIRLQTPLQGVAPKADAGSLVQFEHQQEEKTAPMPVMNDQFSSLGVHMQDLESALHYAFRQEIAICHTIDGKKLDALRNFVTALAKFFPGRPQVLHFLWKLADHLHKADQHLTGETWAKAVDELQDTDAFLSDKILWVGCQGSQPRYRGYPCSMWTLFHTLTMAAYEHTGSAVNPQEVPLAIRSYMEHFFGCQQCSQNFLRMAATIEKEIHKPLDAVLWLWAAHNKANKRLHGDASEDPQHPKIQFPSVQACRSCRSTHNSTSDPYPGWNVSALALFLVKYYGKNSIIQDANTTMEEEHEKNRAMEPAEMDWWEKQQRQIDLKKIWQLREQKKQQKLEKKLRGAGHERERKSVRDGQNMVRGKRYDVVMESVKSRRLGEGWGLSSVDIGVCLVFYISCAIIILILYYHFIVQRRYRLPCKTYMPL